MKLLSVFVFALSALPVTGTAALAETVHSCSELTDPQSSSFDADRDTWWRFTDEQGISCAQGDLSMSQDSVATDDDEGDDSTSSAPGGGGHKGDGSADRTETPP